MYKNTTKFNGKAPNQPLPKFIFPTTSLTVQIGYGIF